MFATRALLVVAACAAAACGPSSTQVKTARASAYQAEFPVVWSALVEAVKADYKNIKLEDPVKGRLETDWHLIERNSENDMPGTGGNPSTRADGRAGKMFRIWVKIAGDRPPFRIVIDGEAAQLNPGMAMLTPYKHGAPDEPTWVTPRLDNLLVAIHERLEKYAVAATSPPPPPEAPAPTPWANLPSDAQQAVNDLQGAARRKDAAAVGTRLGETVTVATGPMPAADVVALWSADSAPLDALAAALAAGCTIDAAQNEVACGAAAAPPRARLTRGAHGWALVELTQ